MQFPAGLSRQRVLALIFLTSAVFNLAIVGVLGIRHGVDTKRYEKAARHLLTHQPLEGKQGSYLAFDALLALTTKAGVPDAGIIALQIVAAAVAACCTFTLANELFGMRAGLIAAAIFIFNVDLARWHAYVLTDSLYLSIVVIATWAAERARTGGLGWKVLVTAILIFAAFLRPNGWMLVLVVALYWIVTSRLVRAWPLAARVLLVCAIVGLCALTALKVSAFRKGVEFESPQKSLRQGSVIWGRKTWDVSMPEDPAFEDTIEGGLRYGLRHPIASAKVAAMRVLVELGSARPHYSRFHNAFVLAMYIPITILAIYGFVKSRGLLARFIAAVIASHLLIVALMFAELDSRFALYVAALMAVFAAGGIVHLLARFASRSNEPVPA